MRVNCKIWEFPRIDLVEMMYNHRLWVNCVSRVRRAYYFRMIFLQKNCRFANLNDICMGIVLCYMFSVYGIQIIQQSWLNMNRTALKWSDTYKYHGTVLQRQPINLMIYLSAFYLSLTHKMCRFCNNSFHCCSSFFVVVVVVCAFR